MTALPPFCSVRRCQIFFRMCVSLYFDVDAAGSVEWPGRRRHVPRSRSELRRACRGARHPRKRGRAGQHCIWFGGSPMCRHVVSCDLECPLGERPRRRGRAWSGYRRSGSHDRGEASVRYPTKRAGALGRFGGEIRIGEASKNRRPNYCPIYLEFVRGGPEPSGEAPFNPLGVVSAGLRGLFWVMVSDDAVAFARDVL
jgi:hypothetical protein